MKWAVSDVIAVIAIIASAISPVATAVFNWWKVKNGRDEEKDKAKLEIEKENYQEFLSHYRKAFEDYIVQTRVEISQPKFEGFSTQQQKLEAIVLIYADKEVIDAIDKLNNQIASTKPPRPSQDDLVAIIRAFNSQWQKQQPKVDS